MSSTTSSSLTLKIADFNHRQAKIRSRVGGLYHPILHLHPNDMKQLNIKCGEPVLVRGSTNHNDSMKYTNNTNNKKNENYLSSDTVSSSAVVVAVAWPQNGAQIGQGRLSRLLRRCLLHGQTMNNGEADFKYLIVSPTSPSNQIILANKVTIAMSATTREHLMLATTGGDGQKDTNNSSSQLPSHLEHYFKQALIGRVVTKGTGFSCPVLGMSHTFWIQSVSCKCSGNDEEEKKLELTVEGYENNYMNAGMYLKVHDHTKVSLCYNKNDDEVTRFTGKESKESKGKASTKILTNFDHIGGLSKQIDIVRSMIYKPLHTPEIFIKLGLIPPKGVLMYGPPGNLKLSPSLSI